MSGPSSQKHAHAHARAHTHARTHTHRWRGGSPFVSSWGPARRGPAVPHQLLLPRRQYVRVRLCACRPVRWGPAVPGQLLLPRRQRAQPHLGPGRLPRQHLLRRGCKRRLRLPGPHLSISVFPPSDQTKGLDTQTRARTDAQKHKLSLPFFLSLPPSLSDKHTFSLRPFLLALSLSLSLSRAQSIVRSRSRATFDIEFLHLYYIYIYIYIYIL